MLDRAQFLLTKLTEECAEVAQRAAKQIQFGKEEVQDGQELNNAQRLRLEVNDLLNIVVMLVEVGEIPTITILEKEASYQAKVLKIAKYLKRSQGLGRVE